MEFEQENEVDVEVGKIIDRRRGKRGPNRDYIYSAHTLLETAQKFGITKQGVQKIENRALKKLRQECDKRGWSFQSLMEDIVESEAAKYRSPARMVTPETMAEDDIDRRRREIGVAQASLLGDFDTETADDPDFTGHISAAERSDNFRRFHG